MLFPQGGDDAGIFQHSCSQKGACHGQVGLYLQMPFSSVSTATKKRCHAMITQTDDCHENEVGGRECGSCAQRNPPVGPIHEAQSRTSTSKVIHSFLVTRAFVQKCVVNCGGCSRRKICSTMVSTKSCDGWWIFSGSNRKKALYSEQRRRARYIGKNWYWRAGTPRRSQSRLGWLVMLVGNRSSQE